MTKELIQLEMRIYVDVEEWKAITYPGVREGMYFISNFGRVKNAKGKYLSQVIDKDGYKRFSLCIKSMEKGNYPIPAHRLVGYEFCNGKDVDITTLVINHKDSCRYNNYYKNLEWVTAKYNTQYSHSHGYAKVGEDHYRNTYPKEMIHYICEMLTRYLPHGFIYDKLCIEYPDVCHNKTRNQIIWLIKDLRCRRSWKKINGLYEY